MNAPEASDRIECSYCGRDNTSDAVYCNDCGTLLTEQAAPRANKSLTQTEETEWAYLVLRYAGAFIFIVAVYLLSFGPVWRYCWSTRTPAPAAASTITAAGGQTSTSVVTLRIPGWVGMLYGPAFMLSNGSSLYHRYLQWWLHVGDK